MKSRTIGGIAIENIPPRVKILPSPEKAIDMSTEEGRQRVLDAIRRTISTHRVAIRALAKR
ncbi:hypothetical protein [Candidatus Burkholderia verschuerenii]|uniref:hypothetical protein n=1 Tax=Candidatus Burkholderia verschuerenii TaxID=242163 RepID=UPI000AC963B3|nr:hypothetical protein [Candidatus Burkholderia verschuerenii]